MLSEDLDFLYDTTEQTSTRFVSFVGPSLHRFDLAITNSNRFFGKQLVTDLQNGKTAVMGADDLEAEGYLEHIYGLTEEQSEELASFLLPIIGTVNFTDI
jgi:hypothetical protein